MNDVKKNLPEWQRHMIAAGARQGREIVRAGIRAGFRAEMQAQAAEESTAARARITEAGGIRALDRRSYEAERAAMIGRLRRAR
ncbi:hypothetical protein [Acidiphilium sp.]|uniref:hypothetical protein n=1 Tax=Acidiphilium sp. TaxID=527 RepID=UPI002586B362|nr:hypothetical protein [Acidiphilium sp.]